MDYILAIAWLLVGLVPIHGLMFLSMRRDRARTTRMMKELQRFRLRRRG